MNPSMPRLGRLALRRAGPVGTALMLWDIWQRIPPAHRKRILEGVRTHGPRVAAQYRARRKPPRR